MVSANYANQLIDLLNAIGKATVSPVANVGSIKGGITGFQWDFAPLDGRLKALESLLYVNGTANLTARVTNIENRLANANIAASGTCSGNNISINISLNI